jgi:ureidoacrylate peracid hydrolase
MNPVCRVLGGRQDKTHSNLGIVCTVFHGALLEEAIAHGHYLGWHRRDACDLGYQVTQVTDCCVTYSQQRHDASLRAIAGYCRQRTCDDVCTELDRRVGSGGPAASA